MLETEIRAKLPELQALPTETEWVEFKHNNANPQQIGEYISALSNSACLHRKEKAFLLFGFDNISHKILGTLFAPLATKGKGNEDLEPCLARSLNPRIDFKIHSFEQEGKQIVVFVIDPPRERPVEFIGVAYIRVGANKTKLSGFPEKERKIWENTAHKTFEDGIALSNVSVEEILRLLDCEGFFSLLNIPKPTDAAGMVDKLISEKIILRKQSHYSVTNLGGMLLAKELTNFESLTRKAIRVIQYKGKNRLNIIKEREWTRGYAVGFRELIQYINDQLPTNEIIEKALRRTVKMYPEKVIRELVANALIHQDFSEIGTGPMVEIFEDRIEITNPGKPLVEPLRFIDHLPKSRNEKLARLMRFLGICEELGTGIDNVINETEKYQLPAPDFIQENSYTKAIVYSYRTMSQMDRKDKIRAAYQHCCLKHVFNEKMTNQSLRERFKIEQRNYAVVSRIISDTLNDKLIKAFDPENKSRKHAKYIPIWS